MPRRLTPFISLVVSVLALLSGCMSDPITGPEVRPRLVLPPTRVSFYSPPETFVAPDKGDMVVRWNRSPADTQLNFKGYFVHLWKTTTTFDSVLHGPNINWTELVDSAHVRKLPGQLDTSYTFHSRQLGEYTAVIWGEKATDTVGYSLDSTLGTFTFDPRPLTNPTNLQATSSGPGKVRLKWDLPTTYSHIGMAGVAIYYRDPFLRNDSAHRLQIVATKDSIVRTADVSIPPLQDGLRGSTERAVQFWVKSVRNDSVYFYGSDTNSIIWAGAQLFAYPPVTSAVDTNGKRDSSRHGWRHAIFMGVTGTNFGVTDDSIDANAQVKILIANGVVTLQGMNGAAFLDGPRMDAAPTLDSIFYSSPYADPAQFNTSNVTLPTSSDSNVVLYLKFPDLSWKPQLPSEWARILVYRQKDGSFVNGSGAIDIAVSFQPGVAFGGTAHLPYY